MERITLSGQLTPTHSFELAAQLDELTATLRPAVTVDLSEVDELHPSIVSVLVRSRRQARRQGGNVLLIAPATRMAHRTLDHVGLDMVNLARVPA
jgi:anti-anti-sigma regulatory factor